MRKEIVMHFLLVFCKNRTQVDGIKSNRFPQTATYPISLLFSSIHPSPVCSQDSPLPIHTQCIKD